MNQLDKDHPLRKIASRSSGVPTPAFLQSNHPSSRDLMQGALEVGQINDMLGLSAQGREQQAKLEASEQTIRKVKKHLDTEFDAGMILIGNKATVDSGIEQLNMATVDDFPDMVAQYLHPGEIAFRASQTDWVDATIEQAKPPIDIPDQSERNQLLASAATDFFHKNIINRAQHMADQAREAGRTYLMPDEISSVLGFVTAEEISDGQFSPSLVTFTKGAPEGLQAAIGEIEEGLVQHRQTSKNS